LDAQRGDRPAGIGRAAAQRRGVLGPGRLGAAVAKTGAINGKAANRSTGLWFEDRPASGRVAATARIGVDYAGRFWSRRKLRFVFAPSNFRPNLPSARFLDVSPPDNRLAQHRATQSARQAASRRDIPASFRRLAQRLMFLLCSYRWKLNERGPETAETAKIFHERWKKAEAEPRYAKRKQEWKARYG
jgi:hypothetical protein